MQHTNKRFMNSMKWLAIFAAIAIPLLVAHAQTAAPGSNLSPNAAEVVKLAGSGVGDVIVTAFVQNAQGTFDLSADNVLYLRDVGVSQAVITAMLNHDNALHAQAPQGPPPMQPTDMQAAPVPNAPAPGPAPAPEVAYPGAAPASAAPAPQPAPAPVSYVGSPPPDVSYFYDDLAPYGAWVSLPAVGWCWQPSVVVVNRGWRPYCDSGHWVSTDAGWFWQSDYTWGWAPFYYGRWYQDAGCGWVWVPGQVWGPAWVTWRSVGTTCGWAPLPPGADFVAGVGLTWHGGAVAANFAFGLSVNCFAFVSFGNFCSVNVAHYCLPRVQATAIFHQTTVINNYTVINKTVVNNGIAVNRIAAVSHVPVTRATLREGPAGVGRPPVAGGAVVYRSPLKAPAKPVHMVAQKVDPVHPQIQHTAMISPRYEQKTSYSGNAAGSSFQHNANPAWNSGQKSAFQGNTPTTTWQHSTGAGNTAPGAAGPSKNQPGSRSYQWPGNEKPATGAQNFAAPRSYQGQTGNENTKPAYTPYTQGADGRNQTGVQNSATPKYNQGQVWHEQYEAPSASKPAANPYVNPYNQGTTARGQQAFGESAYKGQGNAGQTARETPAPRFYTPKTIEQSSQVRSIYQQPKVNQAAPSANAYQPGAKKY